MDFFASTWWIWLVLMIGSLGYFILKLVRKMKEGFDSNSESMDFGAEEDNFFSGIANLIISAGFFSLASLLFIASIAINIWGGKS